MAGFEGADHVNVHGEPIDMVAITGHHHRIDADYARLASIGLRAARESIGWRLAEPLGDGSYDFSRARDMARCARRHGIEVAWTLMHYGVPPGVSLLDDDLISRLAAFAGAAARALAPFIGPTPVFTPVNEISYLAWATCESNFIHPHVGDRADPRWQPMPDGFEVKRRLVQATLAAMQSVRAELPGARFLHIDPVVNVVPPRDASPEIAAEAQRFHEFQWQAWDMLAGRLCPELGGSEQALDLIGINHYATAQWEFGSGETLPWPGGPSLRRLPFAELLRDTWQRYRKPLVVAETGHYGPLRATWLDEIAHEVRSAMRSGVPVQGLCLYPIVDRPDWNNVDDWHRSGLWDGAENDSGATAITPSPPGRHIDVALEQTLARWQQRMPHATTTPSFSFDTMNTTLIVFSHLRWDFVFQRPQHLLSRLARRHRVLFIEEPVHDTDAAPFFEIRPGVPGVEVLRPHTSVEAPGFADEQLAAIAPLLGPALESRGIGETDYAVWFYTPLALPLLKALTPRAVIFDCMDELSAFRFAPQALRDREAALLARADVVLTGGPSLYEAKKGRNPNVLCVPSSVDARHFAPRPHLADDAPSLRARELQGAVSEPRLGYFGVIDERMDLDLIARVADADPGWNVVMVGPVVKVDPASLPRRPNLHWLGQQPYELLPRLVEGWQVCLMPFALNESTRFISPTKTLEYLAAGKPVVSTAIHDVGVLYGEAVQIAGDADAFVAACRHALDETAEQRHERLQGAAALVARYSWDETARRVENAIAACLEAPVSEPSRGAVGAGAASAAGNADFGLAAVAGPDVRAVAALPPR